MSESAIHATGIWKKYTLGVSRADNLREAFTSRMNILKKNQPGAEFWALSDVNFNVDRGEALAIIGRNGAGKSTLLKILSRITFPTKGRAEIYGRIASLLEVGTGFHPELTGRENIFLNGTILGMSRQEVKSKFHEIVAFSGVEKFLDTPVKRYSSGMFVRLAFAVAAHLEPEILIIDEVLAVGDAAFQKKCLGKMQDVAQNGRTVIFVSHNMNAVQSLCNRAILLDEGKVIAEGPPSQVISRYLSDISNSRKLQEWDLAEAPGSIYAKLIKAEVRPLKENDELREEEAFEFEFIFYNSFPGSHDMDVTFHLVDETGILLFVGSTGFDTAPNTMGLGFLKTICRIPAGLLLPGTYTVSRLILVKDKGTILYEHNDVLSFELLIREGGYSGWMGKKEGVIRPQLEWEVNIQSDQ